MTACAKQDSDRGRVHAPQDGPALDGRRGTPGPRDRGVNFRILRFAGSPIPLAMIRRGAAIPLALALAACAAQLDSGTAHLAGPAQDRLDRVAARVMQAANGFCGVGTRFAVAPGGSPAAADPGASAEMGLVPNLETVRAEPGNKAIAPRCQYPIEISDRPLVYASTNGRKIRITEGMIAFASNDSELAFVLSHELAHDLLGHVGAFHGGSRAKMELEADYVGIYITARAGYDVETASRIMLRLASAFPDMEGDSSYPASGARYAMLERAVQEIALKMSTNAPLVPNLQTLQPGAELGASMGHDG
jgi:peptidase M48-like protein